MNKIDISLYFITDSTGVTLEKLTDVVESACKGGATCVQLREKNRTGKEYLDFAIAVKSVTDKYNVPLIIDDRADIALACDAAGVHVGSEDLPIKYARKIMGPDKIVGATAKTVEAALKAEQDGADYVGTGAIYPTTTKVKTIITSVETLTNICSALEIPVCAIGGLNKDNCDVLYNSGISGIAAVSAIMKSENPEQSAKELKLKALDITKR